MTCRSLLIILLVLIMLGMAQASMEIDPIDQNRYETARELQLSGRWQQAIKTYQQLENPWLKSLGELYIAECLWRSGNTKKARKQLEVLIDQDISASSSSYQALRGEALLLKARIMLETVLNETEFKQIIADTQQIETWADAQSSQVDQPVTPGQIHPAFVGPGDIILPQTAAWYVPALLEQARLLRAFALLELNEIPTATDTLAHLATEPTPWTTLSPARFADLQKRVTDGAWVLPASGRKLLIGNDGRQLKLAFFFIAIERPDQAEPVLQKIHNAHAEGKGIPDLWAASEIGLAACDLAMNRRSQAIERLKLFDGLLRASSLADHGRLIYANVLAGGNQKSYNKAIRIYGELIRSRHPDVTKATLQCMSLAAQDRGDLATQKKALAQLKELEDPRAKRRKKQQVSIKPAISTPIPAMSQLMIKQGETRPIWLPQAPMH